MSFTFLPPGDAFMPTITERFAEAEKIKDRAARWTAQAEIALDTGDMYLVGLVLFKAIQEFGIDAFAEHSGEPLSRLQRLWMPGMLQKKANLPADDAKVYVSHWNDMNRVAFEPADIATLRRQHAVFVESGLVKGELKDDLFARKPYEQAKALK